MHRFWESSRFVKREEKKSFFFFPLFFVFAQSTHITRSPFTGPLPPPCGPCAPALIPASTSYSSAAAAAALASRAARSRTTMAVASQPTAAGRSGGGDGGRCCLRRGLAFSFPNQCQQNISTLLFSSSGWGWGGGGSCGRRGLDRKTFPLHSSEWVKNYLGLAPSSVSPPPRRRERWRSSPTQPPLPSPLLRHRHLQGIRVSYRSLSILVRRWKTLLYSSKQKRRGGGKQEEEQWQGQPIPVRCPAEAFSAACARRMWLCRPLGYKKVQRHRFSTPFFSPPLPPRYWDRLFLIFLRLEDKPW